MNDNLPGGLTEWDLPECSREDERFEHWYSDNESRLLGEFLDGLKEEYGDGAPEIEVRNWSKAVQKDYDDYVTSCYQSERD